MMTAIDLHCVHALDHSKGQQMCNKILLKAVINGLLMVKKHIRPCVCCFTFCFKTIF